MEKKQRIVSTPFGEVTVEYDPSMNQYEGKVLFPEKLEKAKAALITPESQAFIKKLQQKQKPIPVEKSTESL